MWIFPVWLHSDWWKNVDGADCTAKEMRDGLEHSLGSKVNSLLTTNPSRILVSNKACFWRYWKCV